MPASVTRQVGLLCSLYFSTSPEGSTFSLEKLGTSTSYTLIRHSLPNTIADATPMNPKKAAEEGHVSKLRSLIFAVGLGVAFRSPGGLGG